MYSEQKQALAAELSFKHPAVLAVSGAAGSGKTALLAALLPVLKENNVVDAGGFGLAIFFDAFVSALTGKSGKLGDELAFARGLEPKVEIEQNNDWEGSAFRYCTEFLVHSDTVDVDEAKDFLPTMGDCDLMVGMHPNFKVHVHTNRPDQVLGRFLTHDAQISEVHIHYMQLQSAARND